MKKTLIVLSVLLVATNSFAAVCTLPEILVHQFGDSLVMTTSGGVITEFSAGSIPTQGEIDGYEPACSLDKTREEKLAELEGEFLSRVQVHFPSIQNEDDWILAKNLYNSMGPNKTPTAKVTAVGLVHAAYTPAKAIIEGYATKAAIEAYDVVSGPGWSQG